jgi:hypothetical protein
VGLVVLAGIVAVGVAFILLAPPLATSSTVRGLVVDVDVRSPGDVRGFTLRADDEQILSFEIGTLDLAAPGFNADHLTSHRATGAPVIVTYRTEGDRRIATRLIDG